MELVHGLLNGFSGLAQRGPGGEIEREGHRRKLALVVHGKVGVARLKFGHGGKRNQFARRAGFDVDFLKGAWIGQEDGVGLQHDVVLVEPAVQRRDLPLAEGVIKGVVDRRRRNTESGRRIAVDNDVGLQPAGLLVAVDIAQKFVLPQFVE